LVGVVASVGRISAGVGYDYLTKDVATSKHDYYAGRGEAPGVWAGRGIGALGLSGEVVADDMAHLFGRFVDPRTAGTDHEVVLGRKVSARTLHVGTAREKLLEPVAAFDVTFSPSKSVSALFAAATDGGVRAAVVDAHERAVAAGLEYLDDSAGHARAGRAGVRRIGTDGFVVAQFRHRTARATAGRSVGDPQLHSHCAILNRLRCEDGEWRTLDSSAIYRHTHAAGALYAAVLEAELTATLGVAWVTPAVGEWLAMREIDGVPSSVIRQWSSRREQLMATFDRLADKFRRSEHRSPTRNEVAELKQEATLTSRQAKRHGDVDLHEMWRADLSAGEIDAIDTVVGRVEPTVVTGGRLVAGSDQLAAAVIEALESQRSWWTRAHLFAEVARLSDTAVRESIELDVERIVGRCVVLEADDDDRYAQLDAQKMTSPRIIAAEQFVLGEATRSADWTIAARPDPKLGDDQIAAVEVLTSGGSQVATVIGPAGAGKTTLLESVAASYRAAGRDVAVFALAANAAQVVTEETGIPATTIATWRVGGADLPRNGLVLIDEASMVPTLTLRDICRTAALYGSRVGLVGDYAQMGSPEAGGLLRDLAGLESATLMTTVRRFREPWEADASRRLRQRDSDVAAVYADEDRITETTADTMIADVADRWYRDYTAGNETLVVCDTNTVAADVSAACQQRLVAAGLVGSEVAVGADANPIRIGDLLQTRNNTVKLYTTDGRRVLNREVWKVIGLNTAGDIVARNVRSDRRVAITADYASRSVVLAYATTLAGAQGRTCDRGHVVVTPRTTAASLYVGMSRGRSDNHAHVVTDGHDHDEFGLGDRPGVAAFGDAIRRSPDGELSATTVRTRWEAERNNRTFDRAADQLAVYAAQVWDNTVPTLPPVAHAKIGDETARAVVTRLVQIPTGQWGAVLRRAATLTNWNLPNAADAFIGHLGRNDQATADSRSATVQVPRHER
jgi:conjugative relaxase-like TrwC/TraI family protein